MPRTYSYGSGVPKLAEYSRDDNQVFVVRRNLSGGQNTRDHKANLKDNQATLLKNVDISIPGERSKRLGSILIGNDLGSNTIEALHNFVIRGTDDQLLCYEGTNLNKWTGSGNWANIKNDFSASQTDIGIISAKESGISPDDVVFVSNGTDNVFRIDNAGNEQDLGNTAGTGSDSPPKSTVMAWYANRFWVLKDAALYFSLAYSTDYSTAFDTVSDYFRIPVGDERGLVPTRDLGLVVMGEESIWSIFPSATPAATDRPEPLVSNYGVVSKKGWIAAGDDIYFFSKDGFRGLKRTLQDKLQLGASYPISYNLKDAYDDIAWAYIDRLSMEYHDNKVFISVPTGAATFSTWIFWPSQDALVVCDGWNARCFATYDVDGEQKLFYGKLSDGKTYQAWSGFTDEGTTTSNGTAIDMDEEGRAEDLGYPLKEKNGGEVEVKAQATGDYDITVYAQFDDGGWNTLGTINLAGNLVTFPVTFPVSFIDVNVVKEKFHLDSYGPWRYMQLRLRHNANNGTDLITILETSIVSFLEEYEGE